MDKLFKKTSYDEAITKLDDNVKIVKNLIKHTEFITTTITDLIKIIDAMKGDDDGYKTLIKNKATQVNDAIEEMKESIYKASADAEKRTKIKIDDYNTNRDKKINRTSKIPIAALTDKDNQKITEKLIEEEADEEKKNEKKLLAQTDTPTGKEGKSKTVGGNPYKTAKKQLSNIMSYIPGMSRKTQKKHRKNRRH
jgi:hypothetical protein